ncbi:MAG: hypothetical protein ACRC1K_25950 [Planctomycetia bacterium]
MLTGTFEYRDDAERAAIKQVVAFVSQLRDLALTAAPGRVLDRCEGHDLDAGRHPASRRPRTGRPDGGRRRLKRRCGRTVRLAVGPVRLERWHCRCSGCLKVGFAADRRLELDDGLTARA